MIEYWIDGRFVIHLLDLWLLTLAALSLSAIYSVTRMIAQPGWKP